MCKQISLCLAVFIHANLKYFNSHLFPFLNKAIMMSPKGQNIFVSLNMFLFLRIIINGQHYIILSKAFITAGQSRHKAGSYWNQVARVQSQQARFFADSRCSIHARIKYQWSPYFLYQNKALFFIQIVNLHCTVIYLIMPHLQQLQPCAEMLSVTTVPQVPGAFFCSLPKTGKKKKSQLCFAYHVLYTTPQPFCAVHMCVLNLHNQVQEMSITVPWTIRTSEILRILLISGFITCTCTLQCTLYILLLKGISHFYYYFSVNLAR